MDDDNMDTDDDGLLHWPASHHHLGAEPQDTFFQTSLPMPLLPPPPASPPPKSSKGQSRRPKNLDPSVGVAARGARHVVIRSKDWAGSAVWAKLARFPWWPAQILAENDPFIPKGSEAPRLGAIPVRFFGTYEFAWIESQRAIAPFVDDDRSTKCLDPEFQGGVQEARQFQEDGTLPVGFELALFENDAPPPPKPRGRKGKAKGRAGGADDSSEERYSVGRGIKGPTPVLDPATAAENKRRALVARQDNIMRSLALAPPLGSPYADRLCLDGVHDLARHFAAPVPASGGA